jgi:hypothetical protein
VSSTGNHSVQLYMDGRQDDGTVWIEQKLHLEPNQTRNVNVTFSFWSESESFTTLAAGVGYVGGTDPSTEGDFQVLGNAKRGCRLENLHNICRSGYRSFWRCLCCFRVFCSLGNPLNLQH